MNASSNSSPKEVTECKTVIVADNQQSSTENANRATGNKSNALIAKVINATPYGVIGRQCHCAYGCNAKRFLLFKRCFECILADCYKAGHEP